LLAFLEESSEDELAMNNTPLLGKEVLGVVSATDYSNRFPKVQ